MINKDEFINKKLDEAESFSSNQIAIKNEWNQFIKTGQVSSLVSIRPEIKESWVRSYNYGINPKKINEKPGYRLTPEQLSLRITNNQAVLDIISPMLEILIENLGLEFRIDYFDKDLYLLKSYFGSPEALLINPFAVPGVNRSEQYTGTNAPALSSLLKKPFQLTGYEHYLASSQDVTCAATPIFLADGEIQGFINAYGPYSKVHFHTLCMVITLARVIEQTLKLHHLYVEKEVSLKYISHLMNSISDGVIALNSTGNISMLNPAARKILGIPSEYKIDFSEEILLDSDSSIIRTLQSGLPLVDKELYFSHGKRKVSVFGNSLPIEYLDGNKGALAVFKEINSAKKFANNLVGFRAHYHFDDLIGKDEKFTQIISLAKSIATLDPHVLITGESGTGKELIAQSLHNESLCSNGPFVGVNCAALPGNLIESELFGYEGGAFTGGRREGQLGKFSLAENGTLFLDEIDSLSITNQASLLRVIQNRTYVRVGGTKEIKFNARLIVASNQDLLISIEAGEFRKDLFYRINVINLALPPLRNRGNDIKLLTHFFLEHCSTKLNYEFDISEDVLKKFMLYQWPGNVRELENIIERCAVLAYSQGKNHIDVNILETCTPFFLNSDNASQFSNISNQNYLSINHDDNFNVDANDFNHTLTTDLVSLEKQLIESVLKETGYNIYQTAKKIGIARTTLYAKINKYQIKINEK